MSASFRHHLSAVTVCVSLFMLASAWGMQAAPNAQTSKQYRIATQQAINGPYRIDVQPVQQGVKQGSSAVLKIQLHNANDEVVNASEKMSFVVTTRSPRGKEQTQNVEIASGNNSSEVTLPVSEAGLWKLEVRESNDHLLSGSSYLMVSPPAQVKRDSRRKSTTRPSAKPKPPAGSTFLFAPRLILASYHPQMPAPGDADATPASKPEITLAVSGDADENVKADGVTVAHIQLFLSPPQSTDVQVFLSVSHGQLSTQRVTIKAGEFEGKADWTATTIAEHATVSITQVTPKIDAQVVSQTINFTDPIIAIGFLNPPSGLNIVERGTVTVQFLDRNGMPVPAHQPLSFNFSTNSPRLQLNPDSDHTTADAAAFHTSITPSGLGRVTIEASVPHFKPIKQTIEITGLLLLSLCALGGALGGLVNHLDRKQKG